MSINKDGQVLAKLTLSGEEFVIGLDEENVMIQIANGEVVFLSVPDTELLIAALKLAQFEAQGEKI